MVTYARTIANSETLAEQLTAGKRNEPIIVIATHTLSNVIDPVDLGNRAGAPVHVLQGYEAMNALSAALPPGTAAYSRPGETCIRVYPAGLDWMEAPQLSGYEIVKQETNYQGKTLPRIVRAVEIARQDSSEDYDHNNELTAAQPISEFLSGESRRVLEEFAAQELESQACKQVPEESLTELPSTPSSIPAADETQVMATEIRAEIDALRNMAEGLKLALERSETQRKTAQKALEACRCNEITEAGSPAAAIRHAENRQEEAELKRERLETKVRHQDKQLEKFKEISPITKWLDAHCVTEEEAVRVLVNMHWQKNYLADDQNAYPLGGFETQTAFFQTISRMHDVDRKKVIHVMTEIVSTRADKRDRTIHPYRQGEGPEESPVVDAELGTLMRIYLENNTAAAKRLHFWKGHSGKITFHSVLRHDDKVSWPEQKLR